MRGENVHIIISVIFFYETKIFLLFLLFWHHMSARNFSSFIFFLLLTHSVGEKNVITDSLDVLLFAKQRLKIQKVKTVFKIKINYHVLFKRGEVRKIHLLFCATSYFHVECIFVWTLCEKKFLS